MDMKNLIIQPLKTGVNEGWENWERREMEKVGERGREKVEGERGRESWREREREG